MNETKFDKSFQSTLNNNNQILKNEKFNEKPNLEMNFNFQHNNNLKNLNGISNFKKISKVSNFTNPSSQDDFSTQIKKQNLINSRISIDNQKQTRINSTPINMKSINETFGINQISYPKRNENHFEKDLNSNANFNINNNENKNIFINFIPNGENNPADLFNVDNSYQNPDLNNYDYSKNFNLEKYLENSINNIIHSFVSRGILNNQKPTNDMNQPNYNNFPNANEYKNNYVNKLEMLNFLNHFMKNEYLKLPANSGNFLLNSLIEAYKQNYNIPNNHFHNHFTNKNNYNFNYDNQNNIQINSQKNDLNKRNPLSEQDETVEKSKSSNIIISNSSLESPNEKKRNLIKINDNFKNYEYYMRNKIDKNLDLQNKNNKANDYIYRNINNLYLTNNLNLNESQRENFIQVIVDEESKKENQEDKMIYQKRGGLQKNNDQIKHFKSLYLKKCLGRKRKNNKIKNKYFEINSEYGCKNHQENNSNFYNNTSERKIQNFINTNSFINKNNLKSSNLNYKNNAFEFNENFKFPNQIFEKELLINNENIKNRNSNISENETNLIKDNLLSRNKIITQNLDAKYNLILDDLRIKRKNLNSQDFKNELNTCIPQKNLDKNVITFDNNFDFIYKYPLGYYLNNNDLNGRMSYIHNPLNNNNKNNYNCYENDKEISSHKEKLNDKNNNTCKCKEKNSVNQTSNMSSFREHQSRKHMTNISKNHSHKKCCKHKNQEKILDNKPINNEIPKKFNNERINIKEEKSKIKEGNEDMYYNNSSPVDIIILNNKLRNLENNLKIQKFSHEYSENGHNENFEAQIYNNDVKKVSFINKNKSPLDENIPYQNNINVIPSNNESLESDYHYILKNKKQKNYFNNPNKNITFSNNNYYHINETSQIYNYEIRIPQKSVCCKNKNIEKSDYKFIQNPNELKNQLNIYNCLSINNEYNSFINPLSYSNNNAHILLNSGKFTNEDSKNYEDKEDKYNIIKANIIPIHNKCCSNQNMIIEEIPNYNINNHLEKSKIMENHPLNNKNPNIISNSNNSTEIKYSKENLYSTLPIDKSELMQSQRSEEKLVNSAIPTFKKNPNKVKVFKSGIKSKEVLDSFDKITDILAAINIEFPVDNKLNNKIVNTNLIYESKNMKENNNIHPSNSLSLDNDFIENKKYPQLCSKNLYLESHNIESNYKPIAAKKMIRNGTKIEDNFFDKKCIEICGDLLICPELLPINCQKFINRECDCVEKCKEKDSIYREFISSNKAITDLEF